MLVLPPSGRWGGWGCCLLVCVCKVPGTIGVMTRPGGGHHSGAARLLPAPPPSVKRFHTGMYRTTPTLPLPPACSIAGGGVAWLPSQCRLGFRRSK